MRLLVPAIKEGTNWPVLKLKPTAGRSRDLELEDADGIVNFAYRRSGLIGTDY